MMRSISPLAASLAVCACCTVAHVCAASSSSHAKDIGDVEDGDLEYYLRVAKDIGDVEDGDLEHYLRVAKEVFGELKRRTIRPHEKAVAPYLRGNTSPDSSWEAPKDAIERRVRSLVLKFCAQVLQRKAGKPLGKSSDFTCLAKTWRSLRKRFELQGLPTRAQHYVYPPPSWLVNCDVSHLMHPNFFPDYAFYQVMLKHPWRTAEPENADLFIVPGYFGLSHMGECGNHEENMRELAYMLEGSEWYNRSGGDDHVYSAFNWQLNPTLLGAMQPALENGIVGHFEINRDQSSSLAGFNRSFVMPYGPITAFERALEHRKLTPEELNPEIVVKRVRRLQLRSRDVNKTHGMFFMGKADYRSAYKSRRIALRKLPQVFPDSVLIQSGDCAPNCKFPQSEPSEDDPADLHVDLPYCGAKLITGCKTAEKSASEYLKFALKAKNFLVINGDSPSTSRFFDSVHFGGVPIIISDGWMDRARPFATELPWGSIAVFVNVTGFERDPVGMMARAVTRADEIRPNIAKAAKALDWTAAGHCLGTTLLTHIASSFLAFHLPEPLATPTCGNVFAFSGGDPGQSFLDLTDPALANHDVTVATFNELAKQASSSTTFPQAFPSAMSPKDAAIEFTDSLPMSL